MDGADPVGERLRVRQALEEVSIEVGIDPARRHRVAPNAVRSVIDRHGPRQPVQPGLGCTISRVAGVRGKPLDRADIDDRSSCRDQVRQGVADQQVGCGQVDLQRRGPVIGRHLQHRSLAHETGVVDQHVEPACAPDDLGHDCSGNRGIRKVGLEPPWSGPTPR